MQPTARIVNVPGNEEHDVSSMLSDVHHTGKLTLYSNIRITVGTGDDCDINVGITGGYSENEETRESLKRVSRHHGTLQASRGFIKYTDISNNGTTIIRQAQPYFLKKNYAWYLRNGDVMYLGVRDSSKINVAYGPLRFVEQRKSLRRLLCVLFGIE